MKNPKPLIEAIIQNFEPNEFCSVTRQLLECKTMLHVAEWLEDHRGTIIHQLGSEKEKEYELPGVIEWLKEHSFREDFQDKIMDVIHYEIHYTEAIESLTENNLVRKIKLERFIEIIDDVTEAEIDALYARHRRDSYESSLQMRIAM